MFAQVIVISVDGLRQGLKRAGEIVGLPRVWREVHPVDRLDRLWNDAPVHGTTHNRDDALIQFSRVAQFVQTVLGVQEVRTQDHYKGIGPLDPRLNLAAEIGHTGRNILPVHPDLTALSGESLRQLLDKCHVLAPVGDKNIAAVHRYPRTLNLCLY